MEPSDRSETDVGTLSLLTPSRPPVVESGHWIITDCTSGCSKCQHQTSQFHLIQSPYSTGLSPSNTRECSPKVHSDEYLSVSRSVVLDIQSRRGLAQSLVTGFFVHFCVREEFGDVMKLGWLFCADKKMDV